jgi:transcriptional regulator with XRE-family HTH domain
MRRFGELIREARHARGWSLQECAHRAGTFKGYLCQVETGILPAPSVRVVKRLCRTLGLLSSEMITIAYWEKRPKGLSPAFLIRMLEGLVS